MPRLLDYLAPLYIWLYALDPALPQALFVSMVFFSVWLLRKLAPNQWEAFANLIHVKSDDTAWWQNELRAAWQMLPAAIIGTIYGVLGTGGELIPTLKATVLSLLAPVVHRIAARYKGEVGTKKDPGGPTGEKPVGVYVDGVGPFYDTTPPSLHGPRPRVELCAGRSGGIQKVEIVITSNQNPGKVARAVVAHIASLQPKLALLLLCLLALSQQGCASWKTVARTALTATELACAEFFGAKQKLSIEDAAKQFCATREDLEPWAEALLAAKRQAAPKALALHP